MSCACAKSVLLRWQLETLWSLYQSWGCSCVSSWKDCNQSVPSGSSFNLSDHSEMDHSRLTRCFWARSIWLFLLLPAEASSSTVSNWGRPKASSFRPLHSLAFDATCWEWLAYTRWSWRETLMESLSSILARIKTKGAGARQQCCCHVVSV